MKNTALMPRLLLTLLLCACTARASEDAGQLLQWNFRTNESFYIDKYTEQSILKNGILDRRYSIKELSVLELIGVKNGNQLLSGVYRSYERNMQLTNGPYRLTTEYPLFFAVSNNGILTVPENAELPNIRDLPFFPSGAVRPGDRWSHSAYEIFLFTPPIRVPFMVDYEYAGRETRDGIDCGRIDFSYTLDFGNTGGDMDVPNRFAGTSTYSLWYALKERAPWYLESTYDIIFIYADGTAVEYKGDLTGHYYRHKRYHASDRSVLLKTVRKALGPLKNTVTVGTNDRGVVISLSEIFFDFDSSKLSAAARQKLGKIGALLKKNSGFEVIVEGHTDDVGDADYNQRLSEDRASATLGYFVRNGDIDPGRGSYLGKGELEPAWPNDSDANRRKNRRVDIIIKQE